MKADYLVHQQLGHLHDGSRKASVESGSTRPHEGGFPSSTSTPSVRSQPPFDSNESRDHQVTDSGDTKSEQSGTDDILALRSASPSRRHGKVTGWRKGAFICACGATIVLIINTVFIIWATQASTMESGIRTLINGSCSKVKKWSLWLHIGINILSTLMLAASNYCMQYLTSPTRATVDKAHAQMELLDIGVPSVRNLWWISRSRRIVWFLLGLSSIPLHLM